MSYLSQLLKKWCLEVGVTGRIATHTLRKTVARINHELYDVPLSTITFALNHDSERTTARYLGLVEADVAAVYAHQI